MSEYDGTILFKDWLPDLPALNNPGLTEAQNVLPVDGGYASFAPLATAGAQISGAQPVGGIAYDWSGGGHVQYVGTSLNVLRAVSLGAWATINSAALTTPAFWRFALFDELLIATNYNNFPQAHTAGTATTLGSLATSGTAPPAQHVGVIGQFVVLGALVDAANPAAHATVQWSGVNAPRSWPTPNSATAIAMQSGSQILNQSFGTVNSIMGGDQFGLILQPGGITRMTYVGGSTVFQFDEIEHGRGCYFPNATVQFGELTYFVSLDGFYVTDGVSVKSISAGKVGRYFQTSVDLTYAARMFGAVDSFRKFIYWAYADTGTAAGLPSKLLVYSIETGRWTVSSHSAQSMFQFASSVVGNVVMGTPLTRIFGFTANNYIGHFNGTPTSAILTTGEMELNPGGFARVGGVKPLVDATAVTSQVFTRNDQSSGTVSGPAVTANSRTGFANFRSEARYHRASLAISGTFNAAQGLEYQAEASGYT